MPYLYILTGSNGAGKSTVGPSYFPEAGEFFDGDKLYLERRSALWKQGLKVQRELVSQATKYVNDVFSNAVENSLSQNKSFAYEGHFSKEESWVIPELFKKKGYRLHVVFFGLDNTNLSSDRVLIRAKEGGHNVDPLTLRDNFYGNLNFVNTKFPIFDILEIIETSEAEHRALAVLNNGKISDNIVIEDLPKWFVNYLPNITSLFR